MSESLVVFAKAPEPGRVKTRLCWPPEDAAQLHKAFIRDVLDRHQRNERHITLWRAGDLEHPFWAELETAQADQPHGNLGQRMDCLLYTSPSPRD